MSGKLAVSYMVLVTASGTNLCVINVRVTGLQGGEGHTGHPPSPHCPRGTAGGREQRVNSLHINRILRFDK